MQTEKVKLKYWLIIISFILLISLIITSCCFNKNTDIKSTEDNTTSSGNVESKIEESTISLAIDSNVLILEDAGMNEELAESVLKLINDYNLGYVVKVEKADDWSNGQRWHLKTKEEIFIFYTAYNKVVSIRDNVLEIVYNNEEISEINLSYYFLEKEYLENYQSWGYIFEVQNEFQLITFSFPLNDQFGLVQNVNLTIKSNADELISKTVILGECKEINENNLSMKEVFFEFGEGVVLNKDDEVIIIFDENAGAIFPKYKVNGNELVFDLP